MITAEKYKNEYIVKFNGEKKYFTQYIQKIMKIQNKRWDLDKSCWIIKDSELEYLKHLFKNIDFLDETNKQKIKVSDYEDIGQSMKLKPFNYQKETIKFCLDNKQSLLVLPCGAGKTAICIGAFLEARERKLISGPGLIVVKASLKTQWKEEVKKFSNLKADVIKTKADITLNIKNKIKNRQQKIKIIDDKQEIKAIKQEIKELKSKMNEVFFEQFKGLDLYILNYETLRDDKDVREYICNQNIEFAALDEIHYIKNVHSKRSKAIYDFNDIKFRIGSTATPVPKNPEDIYGLFHFLEKDLLGKYSKFTNNYIKYAGYGRIAGFKNLDHLSKLISPYIFIKTKDEINDQLPELMVIPKIIEMTNEQLEVHYKIMQELDTLNEKQFKIRKQCKSEKEAKNSEELQKVDMLILALQTFAQELADAPELLQISNSELSKKYVPSNLKSPKIELAIELIQQVIDSGQKVCIFSKYERMQGLLTKAIQKAKIKTKIAYVNGSIKDEDRYKEVYNKFRDDEDYKVLLMSDAGAEGINLSSCQYLIEMELAESFAIQTQRHGRLERADSKHDNVFVYQLKCKDSWDDIQQKIVDKKEAYLLELIKKE